jgi:1-acyl-sn-glycerol-3-phosphate acyltransferase
MGLALRSLWLLLYLPLAGLVRTRYHNIEGIPQQGPAILVVNHVSHIDPFLVAKFVLDAARTPRFLAKESIFAVPVVGAFMRGAQQIPVKRGTADARQSLDAAVQALRDGKVIVLHPEGTVTRDPEGWPMVGKTGAARLAMLAPDVPVVPIAQWGVQQQFDLYKKKVKLFPRPRHEIRVGSPIDLSAFRDRAGDTAALREITELIMRRLRENVAELRGVPAPTGDLFYWVRPEPDASKPGDAA